MNNTSSPSLLLLALSSFKEIATADGSFVEDVLDKAVGPMRLSGKLPLICNRLRDVDGVDATE